MKMSVFAVRDRQINAYGQPVYCQSVGEAIRSFTDAVNTPDANSMLYKHPEDFELFQVGVFDTETGRFENLPECVQLAIGSNAAIRKVTE